jgi:traG family protein
MEQQIQANYRQIKQDIVELVENELIRIENDPALKHLLGGNEGEYRHSKTKMLL